MTKGLCQDSTEGLRAETETATACLSTQTRVDRRESCHSPGLPTLFMTNWGWRLDSGGSKALLGEEDERGLTFFCWLFQIENPRYLREKPVPLSPVSCQGLPRGLCLSLNFTITLSTNLFPLYLCRFSSQALGGTALWVRIRAHSLFRARRYAPKSS